MNSPTSPITAGTASLTLTQTEKNAPADSQKHTQNLTFAGFTVEKASTDSEAFLPQQQETQFRTTPPKKPGSVTGDSLSIVRSSTSVQDNQERIDPTLAACTAAMQNSKHVPDNKKAVEAFLNIPSLIEGWREEGQN